MSLWKIAWRSIQHRSLASVLTAFSMSLGVALVVTVLVIYAVINSAFQRSAQGYDMIVGAKGSPIELVLGTVFYINPTDSHPETVPYGLYRDIFRKFPGEIEKAIPIAIGEPFKGFPVVATRRDFFEELTFGDGKKYRFRTGENFQGSDYHSAVVGYTAAKKLGLKTGDTIRLHQQDPSGEGKDAFIIRGVLAFSGTPNDQAIFVNLEGFYEMNASLENLVDKVREGQKEKKTETERAITAILVRTKMKQNDYQKVDLSGKNKKTDDKNESAGKAWGDQIYQDEGKLTGGAKSTSVYDSGVMSMKPRIEEDKEYSMQAVYPAVVITNLFQQIIGNIQFVLVILACLVVVVAGTGMMVSIYNTMNERRHEIAIMRALGAKRRTVMFVILLESILLSLGGGLVGFLVGHGLIGVLSPWISESVRVPVSAFQFQTIELLLIPGLTILASIVGYLPAVMAYRTDVAESL